MVTDFCTSDGQTSVAFPTYLASLCSKSVPAESSSSLCGEQRGFWLTGPLGQPGRQDGDCARGERRDPLLSSLPVATHMRTGSEMDIGAAQTGQFRRPKTGLDSEAEQCGVAPPGPARPIGRGEQSVDFRLGQEGHEPSIETLWWNGKNALDGRCMLWMPKRRVSEQGTNGSKPRIAGAHAVLSLVFQVVEEGTDQRSIKIVDIQLAWGIAFPV
jgi:hypothetical protein